METAPRNRGIDAAHSKVPADLSAALTDLMTVCNRVGKRFPTAKKFAMEIAEGLPPAAAVRLVIRLLEGGTSDAPTMSETDRERLAYLEQHARHLQEQLERREGGGPMDVQQAEERRLRERDRELDAEDRKLKNAIFALERVTFGKRPANYDRKMTPCPWPGCGRSMAPQGHRTHIEKHERDTGMKLADAKAEAALKPQSIEAGSSVASATRL